MNIEAVREQIQKHGVATLTTKLRVPYGSHDSITRSHTVFVSEVTDTHVIGTHDQNSSFSRNSPYIASTRPFQVKHSNGRFKFGGGSTVSFGFKFSDLVVE